MKNLGYLVLSLVSEEIYSLRQTDVFIKLKIKNFIKNFLENLNLKNSSFN